MKLPNVDAARIPGDKIVEYLLSSTHRAGKSKAAFFGAFGFHVEKWEVLATALKRHAMENSVIKAEETPFGTRYVVDGMLTAPNGISLNIRSAWFIDKGKSEPRFITAFPLERKNYD